MKIYTKTGDAGETSLIGGTRVAKSDLRVSLYGLLDDLNSKIGFAAALVDEDLRNDLQEIQRELFSLQALAACEPSKREQYRIEDIRTEAVKLIEDKIDHYQKDLPPLTQFILPGGTDLASAYLHVCRTAARNAEREMVRVLDEMTNHFSVEARSFVNRLSDYFFVVARFANLKKGGKESSAKS